jgi:hypothetical protein
MENTATGELNPAQSILMTLNFASLSWRLNRMPMLLRSPAKMELLTTSFLSGCACGKTRGGYHVACLRPSPHLQSCHCYLSRSYLTTNIR